MSSACSQALGLPEIVAAILEQLHCDWSLFAALQVNRLWADEATAVLWRVNPPIQGLMQISNIERRQYYANKISSLDILEESEENWGQLVNIRFPRLAKLFTILVDERNLQHLYHFLQPTLRSLKFLGFNLRLESLLQIAARCPNLLLLSLTWPQCPLLSRDLVQIMDLMPSLTHISLYKIGDVELYVHLASRPNLQGLYILDPTLTEDATMRILATLTNPYSGLRSLRLRAEDKAFHCLAKHLSSLNVLELTLVDTSADILCVISDCINLAKINVRFTGDAYVPAEGLLAVARKCLHLRVFILSGRFIVDGGSITDDIISQVATYLPSMTCFWLAIKTNLTTAALLYLGDRCTKLRECLLYGDFDLEQLWRPNSAPLFPQFKLLQLFHISKNVPHERARSILLQTCPQLIGHKPATPIPGITDRSICVRYPEYSAVVYDFLGRRSM